MIPASDCQQTLSKIVAEKRAPTEVSQNDSENNF